MKENVREFDTARYLDSEELITQYLNAALEDGNPDLLLMALGNIAKARGMTKIAKSTGLGRESLYKSLSVGSKPQYETIMKVMKALGIKLHATAATV
ncbi:MAG: addiction module antidote protein [Methylococcaceae bacterium]